MVVARKAGASREDLHQRAFAGEFVPSTPFDPRVPLEGQQLRIEGLERSLTDAMVRIEFANGATDYGTLERRDPCTAQDDFSGSGLDATLQRIVLSGVNGAACVSRSSSVGGRT